MTAVRVHVKALDVTPTVRAYYRHLRKAFGRRDANLICFGFMAGLKFAQPELVEFAALRVLAEHARHDEGCNAPFGYRCKCGYDDAAKDLRDVTA